MTAALGRAAWLFVLWVVLIGTAPADLAAGIVPALLAAWASVRLLPPGESRVRLSALPGYAVRFVRQSVVAGWDVARRVFAPAPAPRTGFIEYTPAIQSPTAREAFASVTALLPGTVPAGEDGAAITYHCLDTAQPVAESLRADEAAFARLLGEGRKGG
jgi:multicomponent Na+:H+ antiporter subunit E